jgi:eukaryotic-like serine/threonine-protein kinase
VATTATLLGGRYQLDGLIARGGMADVYRAGDLRLQRPVAVKMLRDAKQAPRFDAEIHTLAQLRHPGIVSLLDAGTTPDGTPFLVLELRTEPTLEALLARGPLAPERVASIGRGLADALAYLHAQGVVHRDVKPGNVFVDEHDAVRLTDFGIARVAGAASLTATGFTMGTARYLAPEQLESRSVTPAVDVYALGLVMIECLSGEPAFAGTHAEMASARLVRAPALPPSTPAQWGALLGAMTSRDPELRPDAALVATELATVGAPVALGAPAAPTPTMPLPVATPTRGKQRRGLVALAAVAIAALAGVAVAVTAFGGSSSGNNVPPVSTTPTTVARVADTTTSVAETTTTTEPVALAPASSVPKKKHGDRGQNGSGNGGEGGD